MTIRHYPRTLKAHLLIKRKRPRSIEYRMSYLGAQCEMSYKAKRTTTRTFHFGIVNYIPGFRVRKRPA